MPQALVITSDHWHIGFCGCYGNEWIETPGLDQFGLAGVVFDQHFAESPALDVPQHAWWTGRSQLTRAAGLPLPSWLTKFRETGGKARLVVFGSPQLPLPENDFDQVVRFETPPMTQLPDAGDIPAAIRRVTTQVESLAEHPDRSRLLWIHIAGWSPENPSAAYEEWYAEAADQPGDGPVAEEFDESLFPPQFWRRKRASPRELAAAQLEEVPWESQLADGTLVDWRRRRNMYAGQASHWDRWLGHWLQAAIRIQEQTPLLALFTAAIGMPLGEHLEQNPFGLWPETLATPLLLRAPGLPGATGRRRCLTQPVDVAATLCDWLQVPPTGDGYSLLPLLRNEADWPRQVILSGQGHERVLRSATSALWLQLPGPGNGAADAAAPMEQSDPLAAAGQNVDPEPEVLGLFAKPDDTWEVADLSRESEAELPGLLAEWKRLEPATAVTGSSDSR